MKKIIATSVSVLCLFVNTYSFASDPYETIITDQQNGRYLQALQQVDKLLITNKDDAQALLIKGNIHRLMGNEAEASFIFKQIIKQHPKMPEAYNNLAVMYAQSGKMALAVETLQQAFATSASYSTAYQNLRTLYSEMASTAYRDALNIKKPKVDETQFNLTSLNQVESLPIALAEPVVMQGDTASTSQQVVAVASDKPQLDANISSQDEADVKTQVRQMVGDWSKAWSGQNTAQYLSFYHPQFKPVNRMSFNAWKNYRAKRISKPKFINLEVVGVMVESRGKDKATVIFEQHYRSDTYADTVVKKLTLAMHQGQWKIIQEVAL